MFEQPVIELIERQNFPKCNHFFIVNVKVYMRDYMWSIPLRTCTTSIGVLSSDDSTP